MPPHDLCIHQRDRRLEHCPDCEPLAELECIDLRYPDEDRAFRLIEAARKRRARQSEDSQAASRRRRLARRRDARNRLRQYHPQLWEHAAAELGREHATDLAFEAFELAPRGHKLDAASRALTLALAPRTQPERWLPSTHHIALIASIALLVLGLAQLWPEHSVSAGLGFMVAQVSGTRRRGGRDPPG